MEVPIPDRLDGGDERDRAWGIVGRERELELLGGSLDQVLGGQGAVVLLSGAPGIGKTTLAHRLALDARSAGACVTWGRCLEGGVGGPFRPWVEVLRAWLTKPPPEAGADARRVTGAVLADLLPELSDHTGVEAERRLDEEGGRFRLIDAVAEMVAAGARARPWMVVLDDLQWADPSTLAVAEAVGGAILRAPVLMVVTYRDTEAGDRLIDTVAQLGRLPDARHLRLSGLDETRCGDASKR